jgi:hypothetical protein
MMSEITKHEHSGVVYYECNGIYFFVDKYFKDMDMFFSKMPSYALRAKAMPLYIYKDSETGLVKCSYNNDFPEIGLCTREGYYENIRVLYSEDISFDGSVSRGFIAFAAEQKKYHNTVAFVHEGSGYWIQYGKTLYDMFFRT